jgi:hypothetical protein
VKLLSEGNFGCFEITHISTVLTDRIKHHSLRKDFATAFIGFNPRNSASI